jgi:phosphonate transport system ATP-binding protein
LSVVVQDLKVDYGPVTALRGVSLSIDQGEFVCLVGPSGSGKSTLMRCLNGLQDPTAGTVSVDGADPRERRGRIGFVFQSHNLIGRSTVLTNVLCGALGRVGTLPSLLSVFPRAERVAALETLERLGLADKARSRARELSGGQQQRVAIARALMQDPLLMIADEPVASLDPKLSATVMGDLRRLAAEDGIPVLCSIHVLALARRFADRVIALADGAVAYDGPAAGFDDEEVARTYGDIDER